MLDEDEHGPAELPLRRRADLHQHPAGRRNQPHAAQDAGRPAAGDAGARSDGRPDRPTTLPDPFFIIATQNPIEQEGTYPLPEAQLDRFMFNIKVDYPTPPRKSRSWLRPRGSEKPEVRKVLSGQGDPEPAEAGRLGGGQRVHHQVRRPAGAGDAAQGRVGPGVRPGAGRLGRRPRAGQFLIHGGKALAAMDGRFSVAIDDVQKIAVPVLRHRISTNFQAQAEGMTTEDVIAAAAEGDSRRRRFRSSQNAEQVRSMIRQTEPLADAVMHAHSDAMSTVEKYLKPEVIRQISRLDLRAQFIVKGFLQGLHASPFHGFSVEFSEHRKYTPGDDPKDIDWLVYAKTDKYYVKKFEAETNITGYLVMDLSRSMGYTYRQELTKFEYGICLAAALCYLMIHQQDPVGLITFDEQDSRQPAAASRSGRSSATCCRCWPSLQADGQDRHRQEPDADRGHAEAPQPGDAVFAICWPTRSRCCKPCAGCGTAGTT